MLRAHVDVNCFRRFNEVPTAIGTDMITKAYMVKSDLSHKLVRSLGQKLRYFVSRTCGKIMIKERIRFSVEPRDKLWPLRMGFSFVRVFSVLVPLVLFAIGLVLSGLTYTLSVIQILSKFY